VYSVQCMCVLHGRREMADPWLPRHFKVCLFKAVRTDQLSKFFNPSLIEQHLLSSTSCAVAPMAFVHALLSGRYDHAYLLHTFAMLWMTLLNFSEYQMNKWYVQLLGLCTIESRHILLVLKIIEKIAYIGPLVPWFGSDCIPVASSKFESVFLSCNDARAMAHALPIVCRNAQRYTGAKSKRPDHQPSELAWFTVDKGAAQTYMSILEPLTLLGCWRDGSYLKLKTTHQWFTGGPLYYGSSSTVQCAVSPLDRRPCQPYLTPFWHC
jgi:hypothetical protein